MTEPVEFLEAAHKEAEKVVKLLPPGPWEWRGHNGPEGSYVALENKHDQAPVVRSHSGAGSSWLDWHSAFDAYLPEPEAVLRRITAERKMLELHAKPEPIEAVDGDGKVLSADLFCTECGDEAHPCATVRLLAEGWGWKAGDQ